MNFNYKNPISPITSLGVISVPRTEVYGTNFSVLSTGGFMEVYSVNDLYYTIPSGSTGLIEYTGNTIPIQFQKGTGSVFSPDVLTLNSDNISSGRRRIGMLVYVIDQDQIYQYQIPNFENLWTGATTATGPGGSTVVISDFGTTIKSNSPEGIAFISAWTANTIEGISGETSSTAVWKKLVTGGGGGVSGDYLPLSGGTVTGDTIFTSGLTANTFSASTYLGLPQDVFVTGGTYANGTLFLTNNSGSTFSVAGFSTATGSTSNYYGSFSDTTNQSVSGANIATVWTYDTTELSNGIYIVDGSKITVSNDGIYEIGYSAQIQKTLGGTSSDVTIWAVVNGNPVVRSSSTLTLANNDTYQLPFVSYIFELYAGDYVEFYFSSPSDHVQITTLSGLTTPTRPVSPSVIIVAKAIGNAVLNTSGDSFVTGFSLTNDTLTLLQNRVGLYSGFSVNLPYLNTSGGTITGNLSVSGSVSATTYYGNGSNLTGISRGGGGGAGGQLYYFNISNTQTPYYEFSTTATTAAEQTISATASSNATVLIGGFMTPSTLPNITNFPAGILSFYFHTYDGGTNHSFNIYGELYKRTTGGTETLLFTSDATPVIGNVVSMVISDGYFSGATLNSSDRLVVKVYGTNLTNQTRTIYLVSEGSSHYSFALTTIPTFTDTYVTGFTYSDNTLTIKQNNNQADLTATINTFTGLTATTISATTISGGTLYGDGTNLTGTNTIVSNTVFVSTLGNDSTGSRTNMGKPFLTLEAALTAATSGDLIVVFPGSYTATTTSVNGLAKDGISWYFNPGVTVTKTNSGDMFNISGFTNGFNVYGQADFVRTTTTGYILNGGISNTPFNIIFECRNITQSTAGGTFAFRLWDGTNNYTGTFRLNNVTNTGSNIFNLDNRGVIDITANYLRCTAGNVFYQYDGYMQVNIKANIIQSTSTYAIRGNYYSYMNVSCNQLVGIGNTYYAILIDDRYDVTLNFDYCSGIQHNGYNCIANGHIGRLLCTNTGANFKGGVCDNINISPTSVAGNIGGTIETTYNGDGLGTLTMTHGNAIITMSNSTYGGFRGLNITGGVLRLIGNSIGISTWSSNLINGGTVYFDGYYKYANTEYVNYGSGELFTLQSGKLIISGRMEQSLTGRTASVLSQNAVPTCVLWSGGTLVVNGGTLITNNVENPPIVAISSGTTNLQVLSGGLNTNFTGGTLTAKKYKAKYTVTAVFSTSIALNDGSGATETFTESDIVTYNTRALLAQRMAYLINLSATLDITATQDTPFTDVYFYLESDVAGVPITRSGLVNLTELVLRLNAYAMTNSTGGIIIENSIIT